MPGKFTQVHGCVANISDAARTAVVLMLLLGTASGVAPAQTATERALLIDGVVFVNRTPSELVDVHLKVDALSALLVCSYIARDGQCVTEFPLRHYQGNRLTITWREGTQPYIIANVVVTPPREPPPGGRAKVYFFIGERGRLDAAMRP